MSSRSDSPPTEFGPIIGAPYCLRADRPDPEAGAVLDFVNLAGRKPVCRDTLDRQRLVWGLSVAALGRAVAVARVETRHVPGPASPIELRLYRPFDADETGPSPAFLWCHGGGFLAGGLATADTICRHLASVSGAVVVAVRYRLAPEHDLYAGREDCFAVIQWLVQEGRTIGIDPTRLAIGGDSAGGNLAAAVAQRCASDEGPAFRLQVLIYPVTNLRDDFPSRHQNAHGYLLTAEGIEATTALLAEQGPDPADPRLSPALAPDLRGLPPALVVTAGFDPLRDDGLAYVARLREAGVPVELLHYAGQFHGFLSFDGLMRAARDALDRIGTALRRTLEPTRAVPGEAMDRTLELSARPVEGATLPIWDIGRTSVVAGWMLGERLEGWRSLGLRAMLPRRRWVADLMASDLMNPVTAWRGHIARYYLPIDCRETYRRGADALSQSRRQVS